MADQPITSLPVKTSSGMAATDYLLGIDSAEGYQMLIQDLGDYIIQHATSSLAGQSQTIASVINVINTRLTSITKSVDLNTLTTSGYYYILGGSANRPVETNGLLSVVTDNDVTQQIYSAYSSTNMYIRMKSGTTWYPWQKMAIDSDDILPAERVSIPSNSDMDTYINPGVFSIDSDAVAATISHLPRSASGKVIVLTRGNNASYVQQRYIPTSSTPLEYVRNYNSGTWSDWEQLPTRAEITSLSTDTYSLFGGISIPDSSDLDTYLTPGNYYKDSSSGAATLSNCPAAVAFTLKVEIGNGIDGNYGWKCRIHTFKSWYGLISYVRYATHDGSTWTWSDWSKDPTREEVDEISNKVTTIFISNGSDFNRFVLPGIYGVNSNSGATNLVNCPDKVAGVLTVKVGAGIQGDFTKEWAIGYQFWETYLGTTYFRRIGTNGSKQFVADSWVKEPTRTEVDALASKSLDCLQINVSGITVNSSTKLEDLYPDYFKTNYGAYVVFLRSDTTADGSYACFFRHNYAGYAITEIYKGTNAQTPIIDSNGVLKSLSSTSPIQIYGFAIMMERW